MHGINSREAAPLCCKSSRSTKDWLNLQVMCRALGDFGLEAPLFKYLHHCQGVSVVAQHWKSLYRNFLLPRFDFVP